MLASLWVGGLQRRALLLLQEGQVRLRLALQRRRFGKGLMRMCCWLKFCARSAAATAQAWGKRGYNAPMRQRLA